MVELEYEFALNNEIVSFQKEHPELEVELKTINYANGCKIDKVVLTDTDSGFAANVFIPYRTYRNFSYMQFVQDLQNKLDSALRDIQLVLEAKT